MRRKKPMKAPFVVTVSAGVAMAAAAVSLVTGCNGLLEGGNVTTNPPDPPTTCTSETRSGDPCSPEVEANCQLATSSGTQLVCTSQRVWTTLPPASSTNPPPPPVEPCPAAEPDEGASCSGRTSTCKYEDLCETRPFGAPPARTYECIGATWQRETAPVLPQAGDACPTDVPQAGDSCASCARDLPAQCKYFEGTGCPPVVAACDPATLTWSIAVSSCNPPPPPEDAGPGP